MNKEKKGTVIWGAKEEVNGQTEYKEDTEDIDRIFSMWWGKQYSKQLAGVGDTPWL